MGIINTVYCWDNNLTHPLGPARRSPPHQLVGFVACRRGGRRPASCVLQVVVAHPIRPLLPAAFARRPRPVPFRGLAGLAGLLGSFILLVRWSRGRRAAASSVAPPSLTRRPRWPGLRGRGRYRSWRRLSRPAARPNRPVRASLPRGPSPSSRCAAMPAVGPRCPFRGRVASGLPAGSRPLR